MALTERTRTIGVSVALHGVIAALLLSLASSDILATEVIDTVEIEFLPPEPEEREIEKPEPVEPQLPPEIPSVKRPELVPEKTKINKVKKARAYQPENHSDEGLDAPDNVEAVPLARSPLVFAMTESVGGGAGFEYESSASGTIALPPSGPGGGAPGSSFSPGATNVKVAKDWQITREAKPTNDRSFEPRYPPLAKRQSREARVIVRIDISREGVVVKAKAISGPEKHGFRAAAEQYARKLRFEPAMAGDNPVASRIEWSVHFYVRN